MEVGHVLNVYANGGSGGQIGLNESGLGGIDDPIDISPVSAAIAQPVGLIDDLGWIGISDLLPHPVPAFLQQGRINDPMLAVGIGVFDIRVVARIGLLQGRKIAGYLLVLGVTQILRSIPDTDTDIGVVAQA